MSSPKRLNRYYLSSNCENCFGLCCVALPFAKSADFAFDKKGGTPCQNLQSDFRCGIHQDLRSKGFQGCTAFECFGAGQKVSQLTYNGKDWRVDPSIAQEMFEVFPIMQQLHEMLFYLTEALRFDEVQPIYQDLQNAITETEYLTSLIPKLILELNLSAHRSLVNDLLVQTSQLVREKALSKNSKQHTKRNKLNRGPDYIGAKLKGVDLRGANLRGAWFIAADLREADMRATDLIGADLRDADLSGANLIGSIFLTQAQLNSAKGDRYTKIPASLNIPKHWLNES